MDSRTARIVVTRDPTGYDPNGPRIVDPTLEPGYENVFPITAFVVLDRHGNLTHRSSTSGVYLGRKSADHFAKYCNVAKGFPPYRVVPVLVTTVNED